MAKHDDAEMRMEEELSHASWRKSSFSNDGGNCVEVAPLKSGYIAVRDSKDPRGPVLLFTGPEFKAFTAGVKNGEFDPA